MKILVLHGPNLNLLGTREPAIYGSATLDDINRSLTEKASALGAEIEFFQSNHEGELIERVHRARGNVDGIVINPGGYTHTSVALRDGLAATAIPFVETHLSNVHAREAFRHVSMFSDIAVGTVAGFGAASYEMALIGIVGWLKRN